MTQGRNDLGAETIRKNGTNNKKTLYQALLFWLKSTAGPWLSYPTSHFEEILTFMCFWKNYSQKGPKSKRSQVKTAPIWSKRPHKLVKTPPHPKNEGQNGPKSKRPHFFIIFFNFFIVFCKCIDKQTDSLVFRSRKYL